jgi:hypothetical protein
MKKLVRGNLMILRAVLALCVSVVVAILACGVCFGWFASSKQVSGNLDDMYVLTGIDVKSVTIEYYAIDTTTTSEGYLKYYLPTTTPTLGGYDMLTGNESCRLLVKIQLDGTYTSLNLSVRSMGSYLGEYATDEDGNVSLATPLKKSGNSLSSVVQFYSLMADDVTANKSSDNSTYYTISSLEGKTAKSFVSVNNDTYAIEFNRSVDLCTVNITDDMTSEERAQANTLYILLEYNEMAIADIFGKNLGNDFSDDSEDSTKSTTSEDSADDEYIKFDNTDFYFEVG